MGRRRPTPSGVIAVLALFFALGGSAVAAHHYLLSSTSQIKPSVLKALHGKAGPPGPAGAPGAQGPGGPQGPSNLGALVKVEGPEEIVPPEKAGHSTATCPSGDHIVSGGFKALGVTEVFALDSFGEQAWSALIFNESGVINAKVIATAFCAPAGSAVTASVHARATTKVRAKERILAAESAQVAAHRAGRNR